MQPPFSRHDVMRMLFDSCLEAGSQKLWAQKHELSAPYVSEVLRGTREPGDSILKALGLIKVVTYEYAQCCETTTPIPKKKKKEAS